VPAESSVELAAGDDAAAAMWCPLDDVRRLDLVDGLGAWLDDHGFFDGVAGAGGVSGEDRLDRGDWGCGRDRDDGVGGVSREDRLDRDCGLDRGGGLGAGGHG
jgi:hypothetical protein